jgi:hypothetical protein
VTSLLGICHAMSRLTPEKLSRLSRNKSRFVTLGGRSEPIVYLFDSPGFI